MFCPKCGSNISDDATNCEYCGEIILTGVDLPKETVFLNNDSASGLIISLEGNTKTINA